MNTTSVTKENYKQDKFLQWAHADLVSKGVPSDNAWGIVWNTYVDCWN